MARLTKEATQKRNWDIYQLYIEGITQNKISEIISCSDETTNNLIKKFKTGFIPDNPGIPSESVGELLGYLNEMPKQYEMSLDMAANFTSMFKAYGKQYWNRGDERKDELNEIEEFLTKITPYNFNYVKTRKKNEKEEQK